MRTRGFRDFFIGDEKKSTTQVNLEAVLYISQNKMLGLQTNKQTNKTRKAEEKYGSPEKKNRDRELEVKDI